MKTRDSFLYKKGELFDLKGHKIGIITKFDKITGTITFRMHKTRWQKIVSWLKRKFQRRPKAPAPLPCPYLTGLITVVYCESRIADKYCSDRTRYHFCTGKEG